MKKIRPKKIRPKAHADAVGTSGHGVHGAKVGKHSHSGAAAESHAVAGTSPPDILSHFHFGIFMSTSKFLLYAVFSPRVHSLFVVAFRCSHCVGYLVFHPFAFRIGGGALALSISSILSRVRGRPSFFFLSLKLLTR